MAATLSALGLLLLIAFSQDVARAEGRALLQNRGCTHEDITISNGLTGKDPSGIPLYSVAISNECDSPCNISNVHLRCGWFTSATLINPYDFRRLQYDDCVVNNGRHLLPGIAVSFDYTAEFLNPLSVSSADITC
ncbi:TPD1 protein homolog 1-like [Punica granatum]|uniref:TPD1 protein homolog 1-like n=2 Tax=Punica granatum TaxID=22663 RepID=A0A6P8DDJ3_PUNGR|nr:TPD1 protein homolog 1-like [Punica granatum]PKI66243.1 hypothetical protein CRG98_013411 [Punica granatum]